MAVMAAGLCLLLLSCGESTQSSTSELRTLIKDHHKLILSPTTIPLGEPVPRHLRYQYDRVPLKDITTYFVFKLCQVDPTTNQVMADTCMDPFYSSTGKPLIINLHTLNVIKDPLEKLGIVMEDLFFKVIDISAYAQDHPSRVVGLGITAGGAVVGSWMAYDFMNLASYKQLARFTRSPEFKALNLGKITMKHNPGKILQAIIKTQIWQKNPALARAAVFQASKMVAAHGSVAVMRFGFGVVMVTALSLAAYASLSTPLKDKVNSVASRYLGSAHDLSNDLISHAVERQVQADGEASHDLMNFVIRWNERSIFAAVSHPEASELNIDKSVMIPALAKFIQSLTRPYESIDITRYCLPAESLLQPKPLCSDL